MQQGGSFFEKGCYLSRGGTSDVEGWLSEGVLLTCNVVAFQVEVRRNRGSYWRTRFRELRLENQG